MSLLAIVIFFCITPINVRETWHFFLGGGGGGGVLSAVGSHRVTKVLPGFSRPINVTMDLEGRSKCSSTAQARSRVGLVMQKRKVHSGHSGVWLGMQEFKTPLLQW